MGEDRRDGLIDRAGRSIDRVIDAILPERGLRRRAARWLSEYALGGYSGGKSNRSTRDWTPGSGSADADILGDLDKLRERSRDLNRNDGHAAGITLTMVSNVIGSGIKPQSRISAEPLGISEEEADGLRRQAESIYRRWMPYADAADRVDFLEMQALALNQILENGEAILVRQMVDDARRPYRFCWQVAEGDRLATPFDKSSDASIRGGVEIGSRGQPIAYWLQDSHPGDSALALNVSTKTSNEFTRIDAHDEDGRPNVLHLYWTRRPGQSRGVPFFSPVVLFFRHLAGYVEAEVMATRISSCIGMFIKTTNPHAAALSRGISTDASGNRVEKMQPGMVKYLGPHEDIATFNPQRPNTQFEPFVDRMLRLIAGSLGLSYELVSKDFSKTNYSSARASLLQSYRFFRTWQSWLIRRLCQPTYDLLMEEAFLTGDLDASGFYANREAWTAAYWIAPGWEWVDPLKEAKASSESMTFDLSDEIDENAARGRDWEETLERKARVRKKREELGLPDPYAKQAPTNGNGAVFKAQGPMRSIVGRAMHIAERRH